MKKDILAELKTGYPFLSRVERRIADLILNDPDHFISCSIAEVSRIAQVSQGSINNFSKKFSSGGFSALKLQLATCISQQEPQPFSLIDSTNSLQSVMRMKVNQTSSAFRNTCQINSEAALKSAVDRILSAKKVEICGVFVSGIVATSLYYQLIQLGIPATFSNDMLTGAVSASMLDPDCLVIAISCSGSTKETIDIARIAKQSGVPTLCLTANRFSTLAEISDEVLLAAASGTSISERADDLLMSMLLVTSTLCSYIRSVIDSAGTKHYYNLQNILNCHNINDQ